MNSVYPKLNPLPVQLRRISTNYIHHFNKSCAFYNNSLSIASIGVDNGKNNGFEKTGGGCVKLNGRTYNYLPSSNRKGSGINYFTFDAIMDLNTSIANFNTTMQGVGNNKCSINESYMRMIFNELKQINPFCKELSLIGNDINNYNMSANPNITTLKSNISTKTHSFEVGAIRSDNVNGQIVFQYKLKNSTLKVSSGNGIVEPLCFPIRFPYGEDGFCK